MADWADMESASTVYRPFSKEVCGRGRDISRPYGLSGGQRRGYHTQAGTGPAPTVCALSFGAVSQAPFSKGLSAELTGDSILRQAAPDTSFKKGGSLTARADMESVPTG